MTQARVAGLLSEGVGFQPVPLAVIRHRLEADGYMTQARVAGLLSEGVGFQPMPLAVIRHRLEADG